MSPTETVNPTATGAATGTVTERRPDVRTARGLVTLARTETPNAGIVLGVTIASMVTTTFIFVDLVARMLNIQDWGAAMTVFTDVGGALAYPINLALGTTWLNSGGPTGLTYTVPLGNFFAIMLYACVAWAICYPIRLQIRRQAAV